MKTAVISGAQPAQISLTKRLVEVNTKDAESGPALIALFGLRYLA
jgi:hypothetical protein